MATLADLQALSNGMVTAGVTPTQTVIVQNPGIGTTGPCLPCEDNVCEVTPTQAVTLDVGRFNRSNSKIRARIDTTGIIDPNIEQNMVIFADFSIGDSVNFPQDAAYFIPVLGEGGTAPSAHNLQVTSIAGTSTITGVVELFNQSDVGGLVDDNNAGANIVPGTIIVAVAANGLTATISTLALVTGVSTIDIYSNGGTAVPNGATINADPAAAWMAQLNNNISGGAVLSTVTVQFDSVTYPELASLNIIAGHNPLDPSQAAIVVNELSPLCDSCSTATNANFTTHTYTVSHGISWRDWVVLNIPASEEGVIFTVDLCFGAVGLPNTQMDTYAHQAS